MACYTPSELLAAAPTTTDLVALYAAQGIRTGFYYHSGADPIFASSIAFFNALMDEGFFTGCYPHRYFTPEQATVLMGAGIEDRMYAEGISTGDFTTGFTCHSAGDADCTILNNLSTDGYVTGCPDPVDGGDPAVVDHECTDGRCYGTCCLAPWQKHDSFTGIDTSSAWEEQSSFTKTFDCDVTLKFDGGSGAGGDAHGIRIRIDGGIFTDDVLFQADAGIVDPTPVADVDGSVIDIVAGTYSFKIDIYTQTTGNVHLNQYWYYLIAFKTAC